MQSAAVRRDESTSQGEEDGASGGGSAEDGPGADSEADSDASEGSSLESMASEERECAPLARINRSMICCRVQLLAPGERNGSIAALAPVCCRCLLALSNFAASATLKTH